MKWVFYILLIFSGGCLAEKHNLVLNKDYDKVMLAEEVSLFDGDIKYEPALNREDNLQLLYKGDQLVYISSGNRKLRKYAIVHKVTRINDSLTLLTWQNTGTHRGIDTIFIATNECHIKNIHHCGQPAFTRYASYQFTRKHFIRTESGLYINDPHFNEPVQHWIDRKAMEKKDTLYKYENIEKEKSGFLRNFVFR